MELRFVHIDSICEILLPEISIFVKNTFDILSNVIRYGQILHATKLLLLFDIAVDDSSTNDLSSLSPELYSVLPMYFICYSKIH